MKLILLSWFLLFISESVQSQKNKQETFIPKGETSDTFNKNLQYECRVFELTNQYRQTNRMLVFVETGDAGNKARTRLRTEYLFKREKNYLQKVFFADVRTIEEYSTVVDVHALVQKLKKQHDGLQVWTIIHADQFFSTAPQRLESLYASHR
jgi:hypothetical protein